MYRLIIESLLGLHLEVDRLRVAPRIPRAWPAFDIHYRYRQTLYHIHVTNLAGADGGEPGADAPSSLRSVTRVVCDGVEQPDRTIPLWDDGKERWVEVELGGPEGPA